MQRIIAGQAVKRALEKDHKPDLGFQTKHENLSPGSVSTHSFLNTPSTVKVEKAKNDYEAALFAYEKKPQENRTYQELEKLTQLLFNFKIEILELNKLGHISLSKVYQNNLQEKGKVFAQLAESDIHHEIKGLKVSPEIQVLTIDSAPQSRP